LQLTRINIGQFLNDLLSQIQDLPEAAERQINYAQALLEIEVMADIDKLR